ncbi:MAG: class A beta-lactamase-related serine hydrolase, partial [Pedobacter sp.]
SNIEKNIKSNSNTSFRIGSISKTFTAALVLKAIEEGKINLNQSIGTFFPSIENADKITIAQLLNHHSGIRNFTGDVDFTKWRTQPKNEKEMIAIIAAGKSNFEPGSKAKYSNANYVLLSYLLEHLYEKPYAAILNEKIIMPLNLKQTQFGDKKSVKNSIRSYTYATSWNKVEETHLSIPMGAGGITLTAKDLTEFIAALFSGKIIAETMLTQMKTQIDNYGMGLFETPFNQKIAYGHDGKIDGYSSVFYYFPAEELIYVLLSNGENYNLNDISKTVLNSVFDLTFEIPNFDNYKVKQKDLLPYLGIYTSTNSPLIISISKKDNVLLAQPKGQQVFVMDAIADNKFRHDKSGVMLEFTPLLNQMMMTQGNQTLIFTKQ